MELIIISVSGFKHKPGSLCIFLTFWGENGCHINISVVSVSARQVLTRAHASLKHAYVSCSWFAFSVWYLIDWIIRVPSDIFHWLYLFVWMNEHDQQWAVCSRIYSSLILIVKSYCLCLFSSDLPLMNVISECSKVTFNVCNISKGNDFSNARK